MNRRILAAVLACTWGMGVAACLSSTLAPNATPPAADASEDAPPPPMPAPADGAPPPADAAPFSCSSIDAGRGDGAVPSGTVACPTGIVDLASDRANCGACGHDCKTSDCANGVCTPETIAAATPGYGDLLLAGADGTLVYAVYTGTAFGYRGPLLAVQTDGGAERVLLEGGTWNWTIAALRGTELGFTLCAPAGCEVHAMDVGGGAALVAPASALPTAITVAPTAVYFASDAGVQSMGPSSAVDTIADDPNATSMASDDNAVYWSRALDAGDAEAGEVVRYAGSTIARSPLVGTPAAIVVDETWLYFYDGATQTIARLPKGAAAAASPETLATLDRPDLVSLVSMVADEESLFVELIPTYSDTASPEIFRISKCGGAPLRLATLSDRSWTFLAVDDAYVYASSDPGVVRIAK